MENKSTEMDKKIKTKGLNMFGSMVAFESFCDSWRLTCCMLNRKSDNWKRICK